ncbi:MAG: hypothetical protein Q8O72_06865 [Bacteroidales bacterium]|nr:hypothetical protein [Bacteroidales bacterium]
MRVVFATLSVLFLFGCSIAFADTISDSTTGGKLEVKSITLSGNKITRDNIVFRELEFFVGRSYAPAELDSLMIKSRQNLLNRSLFNFVTITKTVDNGFWEVHISMIERWYIWPIPIFQFADRNLNAWLEKGDLNRLNYGVNLRVENFRGRMEVLNLVAQTGYDMIIASRWTTPYLDKKQVTGISLQGGMQYNHEVAFTTEDTKHLFYRSTLDFASKYFFGGVNVTFRPKYNYLHDIGLSFSHYIFQDSLLKLNPDFSNTTKPTFLSLAYTFKLDFRDFKPYPLDGFYFDIQIRKLGLGIVSKDVDLLWVSTTFDQYIPLFKRWYFAYNFSTKLSGDKNRPYFLSTGFGYNDLEVRGYELYVIDAQNIGLWRSNFKFEIIPQRTYQIPWIKSKKFSDIFFALYANLFFDMGYASNFQYYDQNPLVNQLLWGTGVGIDFVTYYDVVIRIEAAVNKQKKSGIFINLVAPI